MRHVIPCLLGWLDTLAGALRGPQLLVLGLALGLAVIWFGAQALWLTLPILLLAGPPARRPPADEARGDGPGQRAEMARALDRRRAQAPGQDALCLFLAIEGGAAIRARHSPDIMNRLVTTCLDHLARALRREDGLYDLGGGRFGAVAMVAPGTDLGPRLAERLRRAAEAALATTLPAERHRVVVVADMIPPGHGERAVDLIAAGLAALERAPDPVPGSAAAAPIALRRTRAKPGTRPLT